MTFARSTRRRAVWLALAVLAATVCAFAVVVIFPDWYPSSILGGPSVVAGASRVGVFEGSVREVDAQAGVVHLARGLFQVVTVTVGPDAAIRVHDKIGVLEDLRQGLRVSVCYELRDGARRARVIEIPPTDLPCRLVTGHARPEPRASLEEVARPVAPNAARRVKRVVLPPLPASPPVSSADTTISMPVPPPATAPAAEATVSPPPVAAPSAAPPIRIEPAGAVTIPGSRPQALSIRTRAPAPPPPPTPRPREVNVEPAPRVPEHSEAP